MAKTNAERAITFRDRKRRLCSTRPRTAAQRTRESRSRQRKFYSRGTFNSRKSCVSEIIDLTDDSPNSSALENVEPTSTSTSRVQASAKSVKKAKTPAERIKAYRERQRLKKQKQASEQQSTSQDPVLYSAQPTDHSVEDANIAEQSVEDANIADQSVQDANIAELSVEVANSVAVELVEVSDFGSEQIKQYREKQRLKRLARAAERSRAYRERKRLEKLALENDENYTPTDIKEKPDNISLDLKEKAVKFYENNGKHRKLSSVQSRYRFVKQHTQLTRWKKQIEKHNVSKLREALERPKESTNSAMAWKDQNEIEILIPYEENHNGNLIHDNAISFTEPYLECLNVMSMEVQLNNSNFPQKLEMNNAEIEPSPQRCALLDFFEGMYHTTRNLPIRVQLQIKKKIFAAVIEAEEAFLINKEQYEVKNGESNAENIQ